MTSAFSLVSWRGSRRCRTCLEPLTSFRNARLAAGCCKSASSISARQWFANIVEASSMLGIPQHCLPPRIYRTACCSIGRNSYSAAALMVASESANRLHFWACHASRVASAGIDRMARLAGERRLPLTNPFIGRKRVASLQRIGDKFSRCSADSKSPRRAFLIPQATDSSPSDDRYTSRSPRHEGRIPAA